MGKNLEVEPPPGMVWIHSDLINFTSQIVNILLEHGLLVVGVEQLTVDIIHLVAVLEQLVEDVVEILQLLFTKK